MIRRSISSVMKELIANIIEKKRFTISASISLGIHLVLILGISLLFSGAEFCQTPISNVKVILYPLGNEKKFIPKFVPPLPVKNQVQRLEKREPFYEEKQREPILKKEFEPPIPLPVQVTGRDIFLEEPNLVLPPGEEEKTIKEPTDLAMETELDKVFSLNGEENLSISSLPGILKGDSFSDATSGERVGTGEGGSHGGNPGNGFVGEKEGSGLIVFEGGGRWSGQVGYSGGGSRKELGAGTGSGQRDSSGGGSRKGAGIFGKLFSSSGGTGGGHARYAENPKPPYPEEAREKGMEGEVLLRVEVLASGRVGHIEVRRSSGHETLDESALSTVKKWKFIPASRGDELIPSWVNIPIKFQLQ